MEGASEWRGKGKGGKEKDKGREIEREGMKGGRRGKKIEL